jgi:hypothetical protein
MIYIFLLILIVFALFLIFATQNKKKESNSKSNYYDNEDLFFANRKLTRHQDVEHKEDFTSNKIIENDNALNKIVSDYKEREQIVIKELESNLGKALPNDVKWSILQNLSSEYFLKDHRIIVNVSYQRGLLLQKEKKYKEAITHYTYGLYYLMNFYKANLNPTAHIIDFVTNDTQLIEMAQEKFINKIQLCMKNEDIDFIQVGELAYSLISRTPLPNLTFADYLLKVKPYFIQKQNNKEVQSNLDNMNNLVYEHNDLFEGLEFTATLQFRTPLKVLKHHGEIFRKDGKEPPRYVDEAWQGMWLPKIKSKYDLESDEFTCSSDIGYLNVKEQQQYLDFLIKFHTTAESDMTVEKKISAILELSESDKNFKKYFHGGKAFLEDYFGLLIKNVVPNQVSTILEKAGFRTLDDLSKTNAKELLSLNSIGKATVDKLKPYLNE